MSNVGVFMYLWCMMNLGLSWFGVNRAFFLWAKFVLYLKFFFIVRDVLVCCLSKMEGGR